MHLDIFFPLADCIEDHGIIFNKSNKIFSVTAMSFRFLGATNGFNGGERDGTISLDLISTMFGHERWVLKRLDL